MTADEDTSSSVDLTDGQRRNSEDERRHLRAKKHRALVQRRADLRLIVIFMIATISGITIVLLAHILSGSRQMVPHGAVTTVDARCTAAAINGLKMGANAVDAAIIASLCAGIVRPQIAGIGGGGLMIIRDQKRNITTRIDYRPKLARNDTSNDSSKFSIVGVPGEIMGLKRAHELYGVMSWNDILDRVANMADALSQTSIAIPLSPKQNSNDDDIDRLKHLAETLRLIGRYGIDLFYSGAIASDIVQTSDDSLTKQDIADYNVSITLNAPSHIDLPNDFRLETFAAPTYGPLLLFVVNRMASVETSTNISFWLDQFKKNLRTAVECESSLADPMVEQLLLSGSDDEIRRRCADIASPPRHRFKYDSSQVTVVDANELFVSLSSSLGGNFGPKKMAAHGFPLNDLLSESSTDDHQSVSFSDFTPAVLYNTKRPCLQRLAIGTVDSLSSYQATAQTIAELIYRQIPLNEAIHPTVFCGFRDATTVGDIVCDESGNGGIVSVSMKNAMEIFGMTSDDRIWYGTKY